MYGFVALLNLFRNVDDTFVALWKGQHYSHTTSLPKLDIQQRSFTDQMSSPDDPDLTGSLHVQELDETQRMDIMVTQQWLRVLAWQMHVRNISPAGRSDPHQDLEDRARGRPKAIYPFAVSRDLLGIIAIAKREALESHGIGMVRSPATGFVPFNLIQPNLVVDPHPNVSCYS